MDSAEQTHTNMSVCKYKTVYFGLSNGCNKQYTMACPMSIFWMCILFVVYVCECSYDWILNSLVFLSLQVRCGHLFSSLGAPKTATHRKFWVTASFSTLHFYILTILEQSVGLSVTLSAHNGLVIITCWSLFCVSDDCLGSLWFLKAVSANSIW